MSRFPSFASITTLFAAATLGLLLQPTQAKEPSPFSDSPSVTRVLPANTTGLFLINTCPNAWTSLNRLNPFSGLLNSARFQRLLPEGVEFERDIQPWLGNHLALALLSPQDGANFSPVIVIPVTQPERVQQFRKQLQVRRGKPQIERVDPDRTLLYWEPTQPEPDTETEPDSEQEKALPSLSMKAGGQLLPNNLPSPFLKGGRALRHQGIAIAYFSGYLAISNQLAPLEQLQTTNTERPVLATNPQFQRSLQRSLFGRTACDSPQPGPLVMGYGNLQGLTTSLLTISQELQEVASLFFLSPQRLKQIADVYDTADLSVWIEPNGIRIQTNVYYTKPQVENVIPQSQTSEALLPRIPAISFLSANSRDLKSQWQEVEMVAKGSSTKQWVLETLHQGFESITGLRLEKDVIPWMDGNYAFFLFPTRGGLLNQLHPRLNMGLGLMVQTSDRPAAENALRKLDRYIQSQAQQDLVQVDRQRAGQSVVSWETKEKNKSLLAYSWLTPNTLIVTTGLEPLSELMPKPYLSLDQNPTFRTATADLPQPNQGYFYINMGASLSLIYGLLFPDPAARNDPFFAQIQQTLGRVRSISSTRSKTIDRQQLDTRFVIAPQAVAPEQ